MQDSLRFPILEDLGFSQNEAKIYEMLLLGGIQKAQDLAKNSNISRGNVYNVLTTLRAKGFVLPIDGKVERFQAIDPSNLSRLLDAKKQATAILETQFRTELQNLTSAFTLSTGKPAIQIFEGLDGVERVLEDSLTAQDEILTIVDPEAISEEILKVEARYIKKRIAKKLSKRIIMPDTPKAKQWIADSPTPFTQNRLVAGFVGGFNAAVEIYDQRLSYISLSGDRIISVLINEKNMAALQRAQFESLWRSAAPQAARREADGTSATDTTAREPVVPRDNT